MDRYVVSTRPDNRGDHEVHQEGCRLFPSSFIELGRHFSCATAVAAARLHYRTANGCNWCARPCHTS